MGRQSSEGEKVACPFCNTEVELKDLGGMSFGVSGVVGGMPIQEGTCLSCGAHVSGEVVSIHDLHTIKVCACVRAPVGTKNYGIRLIGKDEVKSYLIREGVRIA